METGTMIVSVWLDTTSDDHGWIVDTDVVGGGESETLRIFQPTAAGKKRAVAFAEAKAERLGCEMVIQ